MPDLVRVRVERENDTVKFNAGRAHALAKGLEILDEPTHDRAGKALPPTRENDRPIKPHITVDDAAKKAATKETSTAVTAVAKKAAESADQPDTTALPKEN